MGSGAGDGEVCGLSQAPTGSPRTLATFEQRTRCVDAVTRPSGLTLRHASLVHHFDSVTLPQHALYQDSSIDSSHTLVRLHDLLEKGWVRDAGLRI
jgi:hypothetical protein